MVKVSIATPVGEIFSDEVDFFLVRSSLGEYAILEDHTPIVSAVDKGYVKVRKDGKETFIAMIGGLVEQSNNNITVVAQEAAVADSYDSAFVLLAEMHQRAEDENKRMQKDFTISEIDLQKNIKKAKAGELI
jgi:F-type H+-transporting ATPase subunit epsilon